VMAGSPGVLLPAIRRGPCTRVGSRELDKLPFLATLANVAQLYVSSKTDELANPTVRCAAA
jgi:hypothetical protein